MDPTLAPLPAGAPAWLQAVYALLGMLLVGFLIPWLKAHGDLAAANADVHDSTLRAILGQELRGLLASALQQGTKPAELEKLAAGHFRDVGIDIVATLGPEVFQQYLKAFSLIPTVPAQPPSTN